MSDDAPLRPPPRRVRLVLVTPAGDPLGALPPFLVDTPWWQEAAPVVRGAREHHGADVTVLRLLASEPGLRAGGNVTYLAETVESPGDLEPWDEPLDDHPLRSPYARPGGPDADLAWAAARLADQGLRQIGRPTQVRSWNLSSLWRLPTETETVWLKHVPPFFAHEGAMLDRLAGGPVPTLVAREGARILMHELPGEDLYDAGRSILERLVRILVGLQRVWIGRVDELLELGLPDWRGPSLTAAIAAAVDRTAGNLPPGDRDVLAGFVADLPDRFGAVAAAGLPDTLVHGDFHPGNARGDGTSLVLLDWGDSGVGHPLLDQAAYLDRVPASAVEPLRRLWHDTWRAAVPGSDPGRAASLLAPVAAARQAVIYWTFLDGIEPSERVYHADDPADWLSRTAALVRAEGGRRTVGVDVPSKQESTMSQGGLTGDNQSGAEAGDERNEGRPSGTPGASERDTGRPEPAREGGSQEGADTTVAPEEEGAEPPTEHAPGSDL